MVASDRDFWGWQNPAGTATNSHHEREVILSSEKREYSSADTFWGIEERSIKYEYFEAKF